MDTTQRKGAANVVIHTRVSRSEASRIFPPSSAAKSSSFIKMEGKLQG